MNINPYRYIMKRYHSKDLTPREFKLMNFWLPFFFNRIKIVYVSDDFKLFTANILGKYSEYRDTQLLAKSLSMDLYDMIQ